MTDRSSGPRGIAPRRQVRAASTVVAAACALTLLAPCLLGAQTETESVGSYRIALSAAELQGWRDHLGKRASGDERDIQTLAWTLSMARAAQAQGLHRDPVIRLRLEQIEVRHAGAALKADVAAVNEPTAAEAEAKYQSIKDTYVLPERKRTYNWFRRLPLDASAERREAARTEAEQIRERVRSGASFLDIARETSDSQTRLRNGLIGNLRPGVLDDPELERIALGLEPGEVSEVLEHRDGVTLLFCEKVIPANQRTGEELRAIARQLLVERRTAEAWAELDRDLLERSDHELVESGEGSAVLYLGGRATLADVWQSQDRRRPLERLDADEREKVAEAWVLGQMRVLEARRRGLREATAAGVWWQQRELLANQLLLRHVNERLAVPTEAELRQRFEQERETLIRPVHARVSGILWRIESDRSEADVHRRAAAVETAIRDGDLTFEAAAERHSEHDSAGQGGQLGSFPLNGFGKSFGLPAAKAIRRISPGGLTGVVQERRVLWLLRLDALQPERPMTFEEARDQLDNTIGGERVAALELEIRRSWLADLDVVFD